MILPHYIAAGAIASIATPILAHKYVSENKPVITNETVQTLVELGNKDITDVIKDRRMTNISLNNLKSELETETVREALKSYQKSQKENSSILVNSYLLGISLGVASVAFYTQGSNNRQRRIDDQYAK